MHEIFHSRGVVGVFWGIGKRKGKPTRTPVIVVHVRRKLPLGQLGDARVKRVVAGHRTDVIEVGNVSQQWLDAADMVRCEDPQRGRSTVSALADDNGVPFAMLSGHATLPTENGQLVGVFDAAASPMRVRARDYGGAEFTGDLVSGRLDAECDFAVAEMDAAMADVNTYHYATGQYPPHALRASALGVGEEVRHHSSLRGHIMVGRVLQIAAGYTYIPGYAGARYPYLDLISIESTDPAIPFSVKGDSGSLVVDLQQRVIGTVVAGQPDKNISYVLPIEHTVTALGSLARNFFT